MCCENSGRFHRRKFKKIANKDIKTAKKHSDLDIYNLRLKPSFNIDDTKTLFNHCTLHLISLRGLGENMNAKAALL